TGVVEIIDVLEAVEPDSEVQESPKQSELEQEMSALDAKLADLSFGINFLKPHTKERNLLLYGKQKVKGEELKEVLAHEEQVEDVLKAIFELDKRNTSLNVEEGKIHNQIEML